MQQTIKKGILLLFFYSLGIGVPFIIISLLIKKIFLILNKIKNFYRAIEIILGSLLIIFGLLLLLNKIKFF
jgi:cytochrome c-type biogenesis protein